MLENPNVKEDMGTLPECDECPLADMVKMKSKRFSCAYAWKGCPKYSGK